MASRRSNKGFYIFILIVIAIIIACIAWFLSMHERVSDGVVYHPKAGVNTTRFYTAAKLLGERAHILSGALGKEELGYIFADTHNASDKTIILYDIASGQKEQISSMIHWVEQGGHLVVFSQAIKYVDDESYSEQQNPLLLELGIDYIQISDDDAKSYDFVKLNDKERLEYIPLRLPDGTGIAVSGSIYGRFVADGFFAKYPSAQAYDYDWFVQAGEAFTLHPSLRTDLKVDERKILLDKLASDTMTAHIARPNSAVLDIKMGQGRLTVLADSLAFTNPSASYPRSLYKNKPKDKTDNRTNDNSKPSNAWRLLTDGEYADVAHNYIGGLYQANNAYLLDYLTQGRMVYLVPDIESQSFGWVLRRYLPWTMLGLFFSVLLSVLAMPKRFGAIRTYQTDTATNIFGFFGHVGRYLWANDHARGLLNANREALIKTIIASEFLADKQPSTIIKRVVAKTGLTHHAVQSALYDDWADEQEFLEISRYFALISQQYQS